MREFESFGDGGGERLVDDHVTAGFEAAFCEGKMGLIGRSDYDELERIDGEQFVEGTDDAYVWVLLSCGIAGALKNGGEAQAFDSADYGGMETAAGEAEADKAHFDHAVGSIWTKTKMQCITGE